MKNKKNIWILKSKVKLCVVLFRNGFDCFADKAVFADEVTETTSTSTVEISYTERHKFT